MSTKLSIILGERKIEVEGNEEFVRSIYQDFRNDLMNSDLTSKNPGREAVDSGASPTSLSQSKKRISKIQAAGTDKSRPTESKPTFNSQLNLKGLEAFYEKHAPSSHAEKILVFAAFLRDNLATAPCSTSDVYTCYFTLRGKTKIPTAFLQAFYNAHSRTHFIDFQAPNTVAITIAGDNQLVEMVAKAKGESE
jgi:hypothetical protein